MDANGKGARPAGRIKSEKRQGVAGGAALPAHDTNEWQDLADRASLVADDQNEEFEQLAGDEADWHPAPSIREEA